MITYEDDRAYYNCAELTELMNTTGTTLATAYKKVFTPRSSTKLYPTEVAQHLTPLAQNKKVRVLVGKKSGDSKSYYYFNSEDLIEFFNGLSSNEIAKYSMGFDELELVEPDL